MYAADLGGRIWRFDITQGGSGSSLVAGGVLATLGAGDISPAVTVQDNRRFYNAPDVALIRSRGVDPYYNIAIGSGYRGHPLNKQIKDAFYSVRDKAPFARLAQTTYNNLVAIKDSDLIDITPSPSTASVAPDKAGWKLYMTRHNTSATETLTGEKVLAESTTADNVIFFTSFQPTQRADGDPCFPANQNRAYAVSVFDGGPVLDFTGNGIIDDDDLSTDLQQTGIADEVNLTFVRDSGSIDETDETKKQKSKPICLVGVEVLKKCIDQNGTVRTFWRRNDAQ
jgi:type IV pilus assembly protein PilY1